MLLGGLWLAQGLDIIRIRPILCFADCEIMTGGSTTWSIAGFILLIISALVIFYKIYKVND